jgi:serine/threonine-protein kinase
VSEPFVGETVDTRYLLRRLVARGGMGLVFEAQHRFTRRVVAIKLLPGEQRAKKVARGRLLREAHALTTVRHPGFVEVLDAGVCPAYGPYVVLEMLEGRTLDGILAARRQLTVGDTVQIGRQVCDAIAHANALGVVHRDLKPSNVFVARSESGEETVKLIDLGVAAVDEGELELADGKLTSAREVLGTPEYMAPEQLWGHDVDGRTDVYAIGMSLYECLTGEVPYTGAYPEVLVQVSNADAPPRVRVSRPDVPPALAVVIETALEKDAGARFEGAAELGRALLAASGLPAGPSSLLASGIPEEVPLAPRDHDSEETALKLFRRKARHVSDVPAPPDSHRRFSRAPYVTPVVFVLADGSEVEGRGEEISIDGMLVVTAAPLPLGAALKLRFASPMTGETIRLDGAVRWTREARGRTAVGIEFASLPPLLRSVVAEYIAMLPAAQG